MSVAHPPPSLEDLERLGATDDRARRIHRPASALERLAGVALLVALWELACRTGWIDRRDLAAPTTVFDTGWEMIRDATLPRALWASTQRVLWALAVGAPAGAVLAVLAGQTRAGDAVVDANVQVLRYVPILALQPLLILWLGVGEVAKVALLATGVAFPVYVNTHAAVRGLDARYHELADVLRLTRWQRMRRIVAPGALGGFMIGFRYASAVAWLLLVVAEQTNAPEGLGQLMVQAQAFVRTERIVVVILVYTALGIASDGLIRAVERWLLRWRIVRR